MYPDFHPNKHLETPFQEYQKRPLVIRAARVKTQCMIVTLEGEMMAQEGDFIIEGIKGERYPCKADIFLESYDPVAPVAGPDIFQGMSDL